MKMSSRLNATELAIGRMRDLVPAIGVCDRIEELTTLFMEHPPAFSHQVEAGILAAVERDTRAGLVTSQS